MPSPIKDVLARAGVLAGTDLVSAFEGKRKAIEIEVEHVRARLPNTQTKKRFDRELSKQVSKQRQKARKKNAIKYAKSNKRALAKLEKRLKSEGIENPKPRLIPAHLWKQTQHILADSSGWAARHYSNHCWHRIGVSLVHRSALCYDEQGKPRYSYMGNDREAQRARHVLAAGLLLLQLSRPTGRKKHGWTRLVSGIPQTAFLSALRDPYTGKLPALSTFNGTHHKGNKEQTDGNVGYLTALKRIGLCYTRQVKTADKNLAQLKKGWSDIQPEEMLGKRTSTGLFCSLARYWIVSDTFLDPVDAEKRARLWVAYLSSRLPEPVSYTAEQFEPTVEGENVTHSARAAPD